MATHNLFPLFTKNVASYVATPLWAKCEDETHTPKSENLESSETPENSELDCRGQNTSHWGVLDIIGKALKCRCPKWPRMSHLDIWSPSYGQKKGRDSNWQFDSRPQKVKNRPDPDVRLGSATWRWKALNESYKFGSELVLIGARSYDGPKSWESKPEQFRDSTLGVPRQRATWAWVRWSNVNNTIWGKVVASPDSGPW
jgi:hypothetical protein